jgi:hypothetical protein
MEALKIIRLIGHKQKMEEKKQQSSTRLLSPILQFESYTSPLFFLGSGSSTVSWLSAARSRGRLARFAISF